MMRPGAVSGATRALRCRVWHKTDSGGVELSTMTTILEDIMLPAFPSHGDDSEARLSRAPTVEDPDDVVCWNGLQQHLSLVRRRQSVCPAFVAEKMKLRTDKVIAAKAETEEKGQNISAQARLAAGKLTDGDVLRCAKTPWEEAFSKERTLSGWQQEGIFPKFNCALFWRLKAEESKRGADALRPPVEADEVWLRKFNAPHSSAASINADPMLLDEKDMEAEAQRRAQLRLDGAPAPERLPAVTAGN
eukprot:947968-Prymnesium_polylepis.1